MKAATAKREPATRPSSSAWDDTSAVAAVTPTSSIRARIAWYAGASTVVRTAGTDSSPTRISTVPRRPVFACTAPQRRVDEVRRRRLAVGAGDADRASGRARDRRRSPPTRGRARVRGSSETRTGTPVDAASARPASSVRTAAAPAATASCGEGRAVRRRRPGRAPKRSPATTPLAVDRRAREERLGVEGHEARARARRDNGGGDGSDARRAQRHAAHRHRHVVGYSSGVVPLGGIPRDCSAIPITSENTGPATVPPHCDDFGL